MDQKRLSLHPAGLVGMERLNLHPANIVGPGRLSLHPAGQAGQQWIHRVGQADPERLSLI